MARNEFPPAITYAEYTDDVGVETRVVRSLTGKKWYLETGGGERPMARATVSVSTAASRVVSHCGRWFAGREHGDSFDSCMLALIFDAGDDE